MKTLNKCLSKLDSIIFERVYDSNTILNTLTYVRNYIINLHYKNVGVRTDESTVMIILQYINFMIQETISSSLTNQFINHCSSLRCFLLQLVNGNILEIDEDDVDFDNKCNTFLNKYIIYEEEESDESDEYCFILFVVVILYFNLILVVILFVILECNNTFSC